MTREEARKKLIHDHCCVPGKCIRIAGGIGVCEDCEIKAAADALAQESPKMGHWINSEDDPDTLFCSECNCRLDDEQTYIPLNYCPKCGAKMRGEVKYDKGKSR